MGRCTLFRREIRKFLRTMKSTQIMNDLLSCWNRVASITIAVTMRLVVIGMYLLYYLGAQLYNYYFRFARGRPASPVSVDVGRCQRRSCQKMYKSTLEFHVFVPRGKGSFYPRRTNEPLQCRNKSASIGGLNTQFKEQPHVVLHVMFTGLNKSDNDAITQRYSVSSRSSLTAAITCRKTRMT